MMHSANREKSKKNVSSNPNQNVNRDIILQWLKEDIEYLRQKARCKNPIKNPIRVKLLRASIYACSVLLSGLKDEELEIRVKQLEETIKNGVVIPGEKH